MEHIKFYPPTIKESLEPLLTRLENMVNNINKTYPFKVTIAIRMCRGQPLIEVYTNNPDLPPDPCDYLSLENWNNFLFYITTDETSRGEKRVMLYSAIGDNEEFKKLSIEEATTLFRELVNLTSLALEELSKHTEWHEQVITFTTTLYNLTHRIEVFRILTHPLMSIELIKSGDYYKEVIMDLDKDYLIYSTRSKYPRVPLEKYLELLRQMH